MVLIIKTFNDLNETYGIPPIYKSENSSLNLKNEGSMKVALFTVDD